MSKSKHPDQARKFVSINIRLSEEENWKLYEATETGEHTQKAVLLRGIEAILAEKQAQTPA